MHSKTVMVIRRGGVGEGWRVTSSSISKILLRFKCGGCELRTQGFGVDRLGDPVPDLVELEEDTGLPNHKQSGLGSTNGGATNFFLGRYRDNLSHTIRFMNISNYGTTIKLGKMQG
jgi:hypothetical protein